MKTSILSAIFFIRYLMGPANLHAQNSLTSLYSPGNSVYSERVELKGSWKNNEDILQWQISTTSSIKCFVVECCKTEKFEFEKISTLSPVECMENESLGCFKYKFYDDETEGDVYFRVTAYYSDGHNVESRIIRIKKESVVDFEITNIEETSDGVSILFNSPKSQPVTISIIDQSGHVLTSRDLIAVEGENRIEQMRAGFDLPQLLIVALDNQEERSLKKYVISR